MIDYEEDVKDTLKTYIDTVTGEMVVGQIKLDVQIQNEINEQNKKEREKIYFKEKSEKAIALQNLSQGDKYYFIIHSKLMKILDKDFASAFRFLYLCTYVRDTSYILKHKDSTPVKDGELKTLLHLTKTPTIKLKKQLYDKKLLVKIGEKITVNKEYCNIYCLLSKNKNYAKSSRVFNNGIRQLYEQSKAKEHKNIGMIIPLLKFMHVDDNVLCKNPTENQVSLIEPLNMTEICAMLGYFNTNLTRLKKKLISIRVGEKPLLMNCIHADMDCFIVNPYVFYKGYNVEKIKRLCELFNLQN